MEISLKWTPSAGPKGDTAWVSYQWPIQGEGPGVWTPPLPSDLMLVWNWNSYIDRIICRFLTGLFFNETRVFLPLNWIPGIFINAIIVFGYSPRIPYLCLQSSSSCANSNLRLPIEKHVVISVRSNLPQKSSTVLSEPKFGPPNPKFLDLPLETWQGVEPFYNNQASTHQSNHKCKQPSVNKEILASPLNDVQQCCH